MTRPSLFRNVDALAGGQIFQRHVAATAIAVIGVVLDRPGEPQALVPQLTNQIDQHFIDLWSLAFAIENASQLWFRHFNTLSLVGRLDAW